jgi:hypothetical protein
MKLIERSEFRAEDGAIALEGRIQGTLQYGFGWYGQMQAQDFVTNRLGRSLGDEHVLVRNLRLPHVVEPVPMILLSPQGVRVLRPTAVRGIFRAKDEEWLSFDGRARRFRRVRPNQQVLAVALSEAVHAHFRDQGYELPSVEPVLIFTNPRTHIDTARPRVRIVQADAIEHFAANLLQISPIMDKDDVQILVDCLLNPKSREPTLVNVPKPQAVLPLGPPVADTTSFTTEPIGRTRRGTQPLRRERRATRPRPARRGGITPRHWLLLAVLFALELVVLGSFAFIVMRDLGIPFPGLP